MIFFLSNIYYMGGLNSKTNSEDTINWNHIKTDNLSSPNSKFNGISKEAKQIIASLNIPTFNETETSDFTVNNLFNKINTGLNKENKYKINKLLDQLSQTNSEELSNTSSFISSEMYDYLFNNNKSSNGKHDKIQQGGSKDDDSSSTSSTSSDSDLKDILDSTEQDIKAAKTKKEQKKQNKQNKKQNKNKNIQSKSESDMSGGVYLSSSAHTEHEFSNNSDSNKSNETTESNEPKKPTESDESTKTTESNKSEYDVNTSDINMITQTE